MTEETKTSKAPPPQDPKLEAARVAFQTELQELVNKHAQVFGDLTSNPGNLLLQEVGRLGGSTMFNVFASVLEDREKIGFKSDEELIRWLFDQIATSTMFAFMSCVEGDAVLVEGDAGAMPGSTQVKH